MTSAHLLTVAGSVSIRERITVPPGAVATIKIVDGEGEVLAATAIDAPGVPADFSLDIDPTFVTEPDALFVWAALRTEVGVWGTTDLVPVEDDSTDVILTKIED